MSSKIQKWEDGQEPRFPKTMMAKANMGAGDKCRIQELVAQMPDDYQVVEVEWGAPVGKEVW